MIRDIIVGLSATFLLWVGAIVYASSRLVSRNWQMYVRWNQIDRSTRVKMAMWLAIPMLMVAIMWQRSVALYAIAMDIWVTDFGMHSVVAHLSLTLVSLSLMLWWSFDRSHGPEKGDRYWCCLMWAGMALAVFATFLSWRF